MSHSSGGEGSDYDEDDTSSIDDAEEKETALNTLIVGTRRFDPSAVVRNAGKRTVGNAFKTINKTVQKSADAVKVVSKKASDVGSGISSGIKRRVSTTSAKGDSVISALSAHLNSGDRQTIEEKMLELRLEIIDKVLGDAERQEKTYWLSTEIYDESSDDKLSYKDQAEFLLEALKLLGVPKEVLEPEEAEKIDGIDRKALVKYAEKFVEDYQKNVRSALKDGDLVGRYTEKYSDISTTIFCALIMLVYNMLLLTKRSTAHNFATAMVSLADGSAPTRTIAKQLDSIEAASKSKGTPAAIALAMAGGAMLLNGSATPAAIIIALALATPAPGRINKAEVRDYIRKNLLLEVSTARMAGMKTLDFTRRIKEITRRVPTAPKNKS
jgi:RNase P protein component